MNPIRSILVIVDPTAERHPALEKSAILAQKLDARMELYICDTKASRDGRLAAQGRQRPDQSFVVSAKAFLEDLARPLRQLGLDVTTTVECADPLHVALIERAVGTTAELVVKDTHHHTLMKRTFLTNTDWHLIRTCPVPLLLTKTNAWASVPKVFAAVDPGHAHDKPAVFDNRIMDYAALLSKRLGGELHVLHAHLPLAVIAAAVASSPPMVMDMSEKELAAETQAKQKLLNELVAEYRVQASNVHLETGAPAEVLPRVAGERHADIVTLGAISRSGLERAFIGSTAEDVLERLPCDAFIVKPPDFASMLPF